MLTKIIIVCLALGVFASYLKIKQMKKCMDLFQVASVYALYISNSTATHPDRGAVMAILGMLNIPLEKDTLEMIDIYLDLLDRNLATVELMDHVLRKQKH